MVAILFTSPIAKRMIRWNYTMMVTAQIVVMATLDTSTIIFLLQTVKPLVSKLLPTNLTSKI